MPYTRFSLIWKVSPIGNSIYVSSMVSFLFEKRCGIHQIFFVVSFGFFWLGEPEREKMSQWLWKKNHLDWPERLDISRYDFFFSCLSYFEMCCDFVSVLLPPKQNIIDFNFRTRRSLWHHLKPDFRWNTSHHWDKYRVSERMKSISSLTEIYTKTNSFVLISIAISFKKSDEHNALLFVLHSISVKDIF